MILVSIIIPSAGRRPKLLNRAIESALLNDSNIKIEVIVVLNGDDGMFFDTNDLFQSDLVDYYKLEEGNVSKARNFGLSIAQGDMVRFLDDDDYLIPEIAYLQYIELFNSDAELSTYSGAIEDDDKRYQIIEPIEIDDYCSATMSSKCPALTFASVYKTKTVKKLKWDENLAFMEDENWMRLIARYNINHWLCSKNVVGIWYQHENERLSMMLSFNEFYKQRAISILDLLTYLDSINQLNSLRKHYASKGLWSAVHGGFHFSPFYWTNIALRIMRLDPSSRPDNYFFNTLKFINPIFLEWFIIPIRWVSRWLRLLRNIFFKKMYVRKIHIGKNENG